MQEPYYQEYRCEHDGKLLFKGVLLDGEVEVKCRACHKMTTFSGDATHSLVCKKSDCQNRVCA